MPQPLPPLERQRADHVFFTATAVLMLLIVVVGFSPSYFLRGAVFAPLPSVLVHLHGAVFSSWILLFVVQTSLISAGRVRLHRRLGVLGGVLAVLMVVLGVMAAFGTLRRGAVLPPMFTPVTFLLDNVLGILVTGAVIGAGIWQRRNCRLHKRLMYGANVTLLQPALARMISFIPFMAHYPFLVVVVPVALLAGLIALDLYTWGRPLAVSVVGLVLYIGFIPLIGALARTGVARQLTMWAQHHP